MAHLGLIGGSDLYGVPIEGVEWREVWAGYTFDRTCEARLAREGCLCYAMVAMVSDHDSWTEAVDVSAAFSISAADVARGSDRGSTIALKRCALQPERLRAVAGRLQ